MLEGCTDHREENSIESVKTSLKQFQKQEKLSTIPDLPGPDVDRRTLLREDPWKTRARNTWEDYSREERDAFQLSYINNYLPIAEEIKAQYGIPIAISLAQALVESVGGISGVALHTNNDFGMQCKDKSHKSSKNTENDPYDSGGCFYSRSDNAYFSTFEKPKQGRGEYAKKLTTPIGDNNGDGKPDRDPLYYTLFQPGKTTSLPIICEGLKGYAQNTKYPSMLIAKINTYKLYLYDGLNSVNEQFTINPSTSNTTIPERKKTNSNPKNQTEQKDDMSYPLVAHYGKKYITRTTLKTTARSDFITWCAKNDISKTDKANFSRYLETIGYLQNELQGRTIPNLTAEEILFCYENYTSGYFLVKLESGKRYESAVKTIYGTTGETWKDKKAQGIQKGLDKETISGPYNSKRRKVPK